ncbi:lipid droplet-associated protein [Gordonia sinesedis]
MGMVRAPYPARIAAGLIVTAIEETRKLPALIITFPMTAVSQTLQVGMRAQQNIAELAIKGDSALEMLFDKPADHPTWARFDEDEIEAPAPATPIESGSAHTSAAADAAATPKRATPPKKPTAPSKATAPKKTSAPKKKAAPKPAASADTADTTQPPRADAGRFALYSSAPEQVVTSTDGGGDRGNRNAPAGPVPEIVEYIEYDSLTLAQLRAKLRSVGVDDLTTLADYEKATRNRAPFLTMLDNRISAAQNKRPPTA